MNDYRNACREQDRAIEEIAARLVRQGWAPWPAMEEAARQHRAALKEPPHV